jgi:predicted metalloprotease
VATVGPATAAAAITQDEIREDVESAESAVDEFWDAHWSETFTGSYSSPAVVGIYDGTDPSDTPACGGVPLAVDNAYYCGWGDFIAYDIGLLDRADDLGDGFLYLVVSHEWGHAIQARLDPSLIAPRIELQADCLAGAALYGAAEDGTLRFDSDDQEELSDSLEALADDTPWTDTSDHGNASERIQAFSIGRDGGVTGCLP